MENKTKKEINKCLASVRDYADMQSVCRLHSLTGGVFRHIALKYLGNSQDADDAVQDFWAEIFEIASKYRYNQNAFAYLCRTFTNMTLNVCAKRGRDINRHVNYVDYENTVSDNGTSIESAIDSSMLDSAIASLEEVEKSVVQLTYFEDKTLREIAKILGQSKSNAARIKQNALAKLREKLSSDGEDGSDLLVKGERV